MTSKRTVEPDRSQAVKIKLHFNRPNMFRGDPRVWSAHTYKNCNQAREVLIRHNGQIVGRTVYKDGAAQPRAYLEFSGEVSMDADGNAVIEIG
jgi:hypothetical protein